MITRRHQAEGVASLATYSPDGAYRYSLIRDWADGPRLLFVMLNPSTATEAANDPTIERCQRRARAWGFGGVMIGNLFAFRATLPQDLKRAADPVGPGNDAALADMAGRAATILCAWGLHGRHKGRDRLVAQALRGAGHVLHHLALSKDGVPKHPLYLPYSLTPQVWT